MKVDLEKIKRLIKESGMTQVEFANNRNISPAYLNQILNGRKEMTSKMLNIFAQAFNVDIYDLYMSSVPPIEAAEGETYIQCPCCKNMIAISLKCAKIKDPEDPFSQASSCDR